MVAPVVSIGIPVYNGELHLREALDSLLAQSYKNFEIIISDNHSTDTTQEICSEYMSNDSRIRYVRQNENIGAAKNYKYVFDEAVGKYFMWAAHDDVWASNWLEVLINDISENCSSASFGEVRGIDQNGKPRKHRMNSESFDYSGSLRRFLFLLKPEQYGKANMFYSLYKRDTLFDVVDFVAKYGQLNAPNDCMYLFHYLRDQRVSFVSGTYFYKRNRLEATDDGQSATSSPKMLGKYFLPIIDCYKTLQAYWSLSNPLEKLFIILIFPLRIILIK